MPRKTSKLYLITYIVILSSFFTAFLASYIRINTILIGYDIGKLKTKEATLLKKRSFLTMKHAKLTTKQRLLSIISKKK